MLKAKVLLTMGEELDKCRGGFDHLFLYCGNVKKSLQYWVRSYTIQHCNEENPSKLVNLALECLSTVVTYIKDAVQEVIRNTSHGCKYKNWMTKFQELWEG